MQKIKLVIKKFIDLYIYILRTLYTLGFYLAFPFILLRLLWRSRKNSHYRHRWNERFGYIKRLPREQKSIWIHAVSVGEAIAAIPLIRELKTRYPMMKIVVTNTTPTGSAQIKNAFNNEILHFFTPFDVSSAINRFIRRINPVMCVIMETEMWPNLLRCLRRKKIPVMLANARLSERSKKNYKIIRNITRNMLSTYTIVSAQGLLDGERFIELGLDPNRLMLSGNIKFDLTLPEDIEMQAKTLREKWAATHRPTFIAASTHEGEEIILLQAFAQIRQKIPNTLLIIVPRHPARFEKVSKLCLSEGYRIASRSKNEIPTAETDIIIGDTMGELCLIYAATDIAFVGGSLVPVGGHNLIEPASLGLPVLTGPYLHNFTEISKKLKTAGAAQIVHDAKSISNAVIALFSAKELRERMGRCAKEVVIENRGALAKHVNWISEQLTEKVIH